MASDSASLYGLKVIVVAVVVFAGLFTTTNAAEPHDVTCDIQSVPEGQTATLACYFQFDLEVVKYNLTVHRGKYMDAILSCWWDGQGYDCSDHLDKVGFSHILGHKLKVYLLDADDTDQTEYKCTGGGATKNPSTCKFTLIKGECGGTDWEAAFIAVIVICSILLVLLVVGVVIWLKRSG